jgi:hypothetical protein
VARRRWRRDLTIGPRRRRRSARFRLTALYCCLFFPSGVVIVVITYVLIVVVQRPVDQAVLQQVVSLHEEIDSRRIDHGVVAGASRRAAPATASAWRRDPAWAHRPRRPRVRRRFVHRPRRDDRVSVLLGWFAAGECFDRSGS